MIKINYKFPEEYDYYVSQNKILDGLICYLKLRNASLKDQANKIIEALEIEIDESDILNAISNYDDIYNIIHTLLNNIEDFINEEMEDFLKTYYEQEAYEEFLRSIK